MVRLAQCMPISLVTNPLSTVGVCVMMAQPVILVHSQADLLITMLPEMIVIQRVLQVCTWQTEEMKCQSALLLLISLVTTVSDSRMQVAAV